MKKKLITLILLLVGIYSISNSSELQQIKNTISSNMTEIQNKAEGLYKYTSDINSIINNEETNETISSTSEVLYAEINNNIPLFTESEKNCIDTFEVYSELDSLGRCGTAYANICKEIMPSEERGEIGSIKPSGWHTVKYPGLVDGNYLYNRCHLIAFCLSGENANEKNLITGTRYFNTEGMLPFEEKVADYVDKTNNHVLYRVTPMYKGNNLIASGVQMEAWSVEDHGTGICFNVYIYNIQPGIEIDYLTGESQIQD